MKESLIEEIHLLLKILVRLFLRFASNNYILIGVILRYLHIQGDVCKRGLETYPRRNVNIKYKFLQSLPYFTITQTIVPYERRQKCIKIGESLSAGRFPLKGIKEINDLPKGTAKVLGRFALNLTGDTPESLQKKIIQIPPNTVYGKKTQIMDMKIAVCVGFSDLRRINLI